MSVADQTPIAGYTGNGVTTAFSFPFAVLAEGDVSVMVAGLLLTLNVHYTVSGVGGASGTVTFTSPPASLASIVIYRDSDLTRDTDYQDNGDLLAATLNRDLDRLWLALQEVLAGGKVSPRSVRAPIGETLSDLPAAAVRAGRILSFNIATGDVDTVAPVEGTATALAIQLASTATGDGAAMVGVEDAGGRFTATNGEAVLAELSDRAVRRVKDPEFGGMGDGSTDDTAALAAIVAAKDAATTLFQIPVGTYLNSAQMSTVAYHNIQGYGDQSQIKLTTAGITGLAFTSQSGVFDDHPHTVARDFRITGDGAFAAYPNAQTGTTTGQSYATTNFIGSFGSSTGMTYELHDIGRYIKASFVHHGGHNYHRANKIGLKLEEVTSFTESNSYFRYNSTAAVQIIGGQNITIRGGAIEGNPGVGLQYITGTSSWGQINLQDVYFESNGNEATGVWSIDVPFTAPAMVSIVGGSLWRNTASGISSGPYRLSNNVSISGATLNGSIYAKYARISNTRGTPTWNTFATEATARIYGLIEPVVMLEYDPALQEYDFTGAIGGQVICAKVQAKTGAVIPGITNLSNYTYPYGFSASSGAVGSANAAINYGDGDFFKVTYAASVGSFSSNYASLVSFTDTAKPYRVMCAIVMPQSNCEIGIVQSVGGQSITANHALTANKYYKIIMCGFAPMTAASFLRIFPLNSSAPVINFLPIWASAHTTHTEQIGVISRLVSGVL